MISSCRTVSGIVGRHGIINAAIARPLALWALHGRITIHGDSPVGAA